MTETHHGTGFASTSARYIITIYAGGIGVALLVLLGLLQLGRGMTAPLGGDEAAEVDHGGIDTHEVLWKLLLATAVVIVAARVVGGLFQRIGQPHVVGESDR